MTQRDISDHGWQAVEAHFRRWSEQHGEIVVDQLDRLHFGNRLIEARVDGLKFRLVRDRGSMLLDVSDGRRWHSGRNILTFSQNIPSSDATHSGDPDDAVLTLGISRIKQVLTDPALVTYEDALAEHALRRLSEQAAQPRLAAAASA